METRTAKLHKSVTDAIKADHIFVTFHAQKRMDERDLCINDIILSAVTGYCLEENLYTYGTPRCVICGRAATSIFVNSIWAYDQETNTAILITVYDPNKGRWCLPRR